MGSGLILLAIVGAWLAVLVPMALRKHDASNLGTVDKFHDAMRVLSRRDSGRGPEGGARVDTELEDLPVGRVRSATDAARARLAERRDRPPLTAAARRRRVLISLLLLSLGTLAGVVLGPLWLLAPHLVADLLLAAFVVHLRRTAASRADREWRTAMSGAPAARPARAARPAPRPATSTSRPAAEPAAEPAVAPRRPLRAPVHVAGIPDRMPVRPVPLSAPLPAPAARYEELPAARGAQGEAWSPVPVPAPTYLSAPVAPRRVVDLTRPGAYAEGQTGDLADAERELGIVDEGPQLDEILDRRRAVNDW